MRPQGRLDSVPPDRRGSGVRRNGPFDAGSTQANRVERALAGLGLSAVAAIWAVHWPERYDAWPLLLQISGLAVLVTSLTGLWLTGRLWPAPDRGIGRQIAYGTGRRATDHRALVVAVEAMANSDIDLDRTIESSRDDADAARLASERIADCAMALAGSVRCTTLELAAMLNAATTAAKAAAATSNIVAGLSESTLPLADLVDRMHDGVRHMRLAAERMDLAAPGAIDVATGMRNFAAAASPMLDQILGCIAELSLASTASTDRVRQLSEMVLVEHEHAGRLAEISNGQGREIATLVEMVAALTTAGGHMRGKIAVIASLNTERQLSSRAVWHDAERRPGSAETIASLLGNLPDIGSRYDRSDNGSPSVDRRARSHTMAALLPHGTGPVGKAGRVCNPPPPGALDRSP